MSKKKIIAISIAALICVIIGISAFLVIQGTEESFDIDTYDEIQTSAYDSDSSLEADEVGDVVTDSVDGAGQASNVSQEGNSGGGYSVVTESIDVGKGDSLPTEDNAFYTEQAAINLITEAFSGVPDQRLEMNDFTIDIPDAYMTPINQAEYFATQEGAFNELYGTRDFSDCVVTDIQTIARSSSYIRYKITYSVDEKNIRSLSEVGSSSPDRRATYELTLIYNRHGKIVYWAREDITD